MFQVISTVVTVTIMTEFSIRKTITVSERKQYKVKGDRPETNLHLICFTFIKLKVSDNFFNIRAPRTGPL